jgi:signal transduction histidine kinase
VLALLWLAYALRLRAVASRIRARMAERMAERERIARDLHDTLLQSVQALTLRFQLVVDELPITERARPGLEAAIDRADQVIAEGRDRVKELRSHGNSSDIEQIITDIIAQQRFDPPVTVSVQTVGTPRPLDPLALDEIARIAGEAIFNIMRHARATRVAIELRHHASFAISFVDNGVGIDPAILAQGGRKGHFGLSGMRERAQKLDGELIVRRIAEGGTQVMLNVPGRIAYKLQRARWFSRRR